MEFLCQYVGGSILYGLNHEKSDYDERGIFINTEVSKIIGLERFDQLVKNTTEEDKQFTEIRNFFSHLKNGKMHVVEALWLNEEDFTTVTPVFKEIQESKHFLMDTDALYKSLSGFMRNQIQLTFDDKRKSEPGSKRDLELNNYGFYSKAAVHSLRLAMTGIKYINEGNYDFKMKGEEKDLLMAIKLSPWKFSKDDVKNLISDKENELYEAYSSARVKYKFDSKLANDMLLNLYLPYLQKR